MTIQFKRQVFDVATEALAELRQVRVVCSSSRVDRGGDVVVQPGIDVANFLKSRTVLWNHDQDRPIARCLEIGLTGDRLSALVEFPPEGVSAKADEIYGLIKAGVVNAVSIGFLPLEADPIGGKLVRNGLRFARSELLEFSFVSVPANPDAVITERRALPRRKGLIDVAQLAYLLDQLGWLADGSAAEREAEGDNSDVPERLAQALRELGEVLVAMTAEEVSELLGDAGDSEPQIAQLFATARDRRMMKSGRTFSSPSEKGLRDACTAIKSGHDAILKMVETAAAGAGEATSAEAGTDPAPTTKQSATQSRRRRETEALRLGAP